MPSKPAFCSTVRACNAAAAVDKFAIVRIVTDGMEFDPLKPFNKTGSSGPRTGTGFFLRGVEENGVPLLITAYHCVSLATRIRVIVEKVSQNYLPAELVGANPKLDVAVLRVPSLPSASALPYLPVGDSDACFQTQRLQAVGFALGKPWLQTTVGVVSGRTTVHIQIDAAVNGGNSGGPVVDDDAQVIGLVLAGIDGAQNVNYICPIKEAMLSIARIMNGEKCVTNVELGCCLVLASPLAYPESGRSGLRCASIIEDCPLHRAGLQEGDLLCSLDEYTVDAQGRIDPSKCKSGSWWPDKLPLFAVLERLDPNADCQVTFWSVSKGKLVSKIVRLAGEGAKRMTFRQLYPEFDEIPYTAFGGVVVQPLNKNILEIFRNILYVLMTRPQLHESSVLVVTDVMPESFFSEMQTLHKGDIILAVDGHKTLTIDEYKKAVCDKNASAVRKILLRSGVEICAKTKDIEKSHTEMKNRLSENIILD